MPTQPKLLINWVYYQPVGHAVEALRFAQAWRSANPDLYIAVALNRRSALELAACVPAVDQVYTVDVDECVPDAASCPSIERIPREWDYVFTDPRHEAPMGSDALDRCEHLMRRHLIAVRRNAGWSLPPGFPETAQGPLALRLPDAARQFAVRFIAHAAPTRICLLFGSGTEASRTPPLRFWRTLLQQLADRFAGAELILLGALDPGRSVTQGVTRADVDALIAEFPQVRDAFDIGLLNQLAIAERCQLFLSPHTGLGFAIQAVGVPWLVLSSSWTFEYWINGVPFVSIYPDCPRYPCDFWSGAPARPMLAECRALKATGAPYLCVTAEALEAKLPLILRVTAQLVDGALPYTVCTQQHYAAMIPRLGLAPGQPFMEGWPDVMDESFHFKPAP